MRYQFQASGFAGGWLNLFTDTESEVQNAAIDQLGKAGFGVVTCVVEADEWNATARIVYNQFQYRLTATLDSAQPANVALGTFRQTIEQVTGQPATVSNLTIGDPRQNLPDSNPLPALGAALGVPVTALAVAAVAVAVILWKVK